MGIDKEGFRPEGLSLDIEKLRAEPEGSLDRTYLQQNENFINRVNQGEHFKVVIRKVDYNKETDKFESDEFASDEGNEGGEAVYFALAKLDNEDAIPLPILLNLAGAPGFENQNEHETKEGLDKYLKDHLGDQYDGLEIEERHPTYGDGPSVENKS